jgi:hypothetical protein
MPSPSAALVTLRPDLAQSLEQFDLAMSWNGFVATEIMPPVEVGSQFGNFGIIPLEQLLMARDTTRAPGAAYNRGMFTFKPSTFSCKENGTEEVVDDREATAYANYLSAEQYAAMRARDAVLRNLEARVLGLFTTANFGAGKNSAVTTSWKTVATANPMNDVATARSAVYANSGLLPNTVVMGYNAWINFRLNANVINQIKYWGGNDPTTRGIDTSVAAKLLDVERVIVAGAQKNNAGQNLTASLTQLWSDDTVFVGRVARSSDFKEPAVGRVFHYSGDGSSIGAVVESYRDERVRGNVVRVRMDTDEQILYSAAGYLLTGANA